MAQRRTYLVACGLMALMVGCVSRRSAPVRHGEQVRWQGGTVSLWDYSLAPGSYENHLEWTGPTGKREELAYVGDVPAELKVLPDGRLEARFYDEKLRSAHRLRLIILTWKDRRSRADRRELDQ